MGGETYRLVEELLAEDAVAYKEMMRMNYETFSEILMTIEPEISKEQVIGGEADLSAPFSGHIKLLFHFLLPSILDFFAFLSFSLSASS